MSLVDKLKSYIQFNSAQYAQVPIGATRVATKGNGTNLYGTIPTWTVSAQPYEIEFDVVFPTTTVGSIKVFFDSDDANSRTFFYLSATGALRYSGATAMYVDGVLVADNGSNHPLDGGVHHIKLVNTGTVKISNIGRKYDGTYYTTGTMFNLRLTDVNNPANSRFYPMDSNTGVVSSNNETTNVWPASRSGFPTLLQNKINQPLGDLPKNEISGGTVTASPDKNSVTCTTTGVGSRAFVAVSFTCKANTPYILMARFSSITHGFPISNGLSFLVTTNIENGAFSTSVTSEGLWCAVVQYSTEQTSVQLRVGLGTHGSLNGSGSVTISDFCCFELSSFPTQGQVIPPVVGRYGIYVSSGAAFNTQYANTYGANKKITENPQTVLLTGQRERYRVGVYVSDSFGNDSVDWPKYFCSTHEHFLSGGSWPGQNMSYFVTKADNVFARTGLTKFGDAAPDFAIIQSSINSANSGHTASQMLSDMQSLIQKALVAGLQPFVTNMTPFGDTMSGTEETELLSYNAALPALCASLGAIHIDVYSAVSNPANRKYLLPAYDNDGVHLNSTGAQAYASLVNDAVSSARVSHTDRPWPDVWNVTWYNRTSSDVVTVYPDAIKPAETFFIAARLRVTSLGSEQYPMAFSVGGALGSTIVKFQLQQSGGLAVEVWDISSAGVKTNIGGVFIAGVASGGNWVPLGTITIVFKKNGTTGLSEGWVSYGNQNLYISTSRPINGYAIQGKINLNGEIDTSGNVIRKLSGTNFHYVYLYSALSAGDITALMQGADPESVGTIRQGYNLNGNGNEVNGGNALTLYGSPTFFRIQHLLGAIGSPIYDSVVVEHVDTTVK